MKKILKNILKWLICVVLTFSVVFTLSQFASICLGVYFRTGFFGNYDKQIEILEEENIKWYDEITNSQFLSNDMGELSKLYSQYPAGVTRVMCDIADYIQYGDVAVISLMLGLIIGTAIYMLQDIDKKGLKTVIILFVLSIFILGFVQGFINTSGEGVTLFSEWEFPSEYIIPVSIMFALVVIIRFLRQKDIANKLNEKLKEIREKTNKSS